MSIRHKKEARSKGSQKPEGRSGLPSCLPICARPRSSEAVSELFTTSQGVVCRIPARPVACAGGFGRSRDRKGAVLECIRELLKRRARLHWASSPVGFELDRRGCFSCSASRLAISIAATLLLAASLGASELHLTLRDEPKTLDPWLAADESAEAIEYLTEGHLVRVNRLMQQVEPGLAASWKIAKDGTRIVFQLRQDVKFPDGSSFTAEDVARSFERMLDPALHSPIAETFKTDKGLAQVRASGPYTVVAQFPAPTASIERLFDQVAIVSAKASARPAPGLGAFLISERRPGVSIVLKRNPAYWKRDTNGGALPRLDSIRFDIEQNRDLELLRFRRGEVDLIDKLTPELFDRLAAGAPGSAVDAGPTLDSEFLWFNEARRAPLSEPTKEWFQSAAFRRAVSLATNRADLCRIVYRGHASPAAGPVSPANKLWFNAALAPEPFDPSAAMKLLTAEGFHLDAGILRDRRGHAVEFSIITNAGSKTREQMAVMMQQDLAKLGMKVSVVTLDFPSLIERITRNLNYEVCLLGLVNVDADPSELMNVLLSSASNHPWNPSQKSPETAWEAEIDRLMLAQAATADYRARKKSFDRVQEILREQEPVVYLLHPNALAAISPRVAGAKTAAFFPHTFWDAEHLTILPKPQSGT
jgi:peptide/nickel transport system substrate-binding protein